MVLANMRKQSSHDFGTVQHQVFEESNEHLFTVKVRQVAHDLG